MERIPVFEQVALDKTASLHQIATSLIQRGFDVATTRCGVAGALGV
jgi:hypothetical protein